MSEIPIFKIKVFNKFIKNTLFDKIVKNLTLSVNGNETRDLRFHDFVKLFFLVAFSLLLRKRTAKFLCSLYLKKYWDEL